jgi:hypothetical protein
VTHNGYSPRTYRIVKLIAGGRHAWLVVSASLRDDETWDVIQTCDTRTEAVEYVEEVCARNGAILVGDALVVA